MESYPFYFENVSAADRSRAEGRRPQGQDHKAGRRLRARAGKGHNDLVKYKEEYDSLESKAGDLEGDAKKLGDAAAEQYDHRNYLDAARFLKAAIDGEKSGG